MEEQKWSQLTDLDFTDKAMESFYNAVDDPYFRGQDVQIIYDTLQNSLHVISFGDYLRRYIYEKAGMTEQFQDIPVNRYQEIIQLEFADRHCPCSFTPGTARLKNLSKNWLTQQTVNRNVVLILGFGLGMSVEEVNDFLTKACQEYKLDPKNPREVLCWYCYRKGLNFYQYESLMEKYRKNEMAVPGDDQNSTVMLRDRMSDIDTEAELLEYLSRLRTRDGQSRQSVSARKALQAIYRSAQREVAKLFNAIEEDKAVHRAEWMRERLSHNDKLYDYEKAELLKKEAEHRIYTPEEITPADLESVILSAIPKGKTGNLIPMKASSLNGQFQGRRLSRQRLTELLDGSAAINRYDLITLFFFVFSQRLDDYPGTRHMYAAFVGEMNRILNRCSMTPLYVANPYECFILMCMLSEDPLGTYADVWELSFEEEGKE